MLVIPARQVTDVPSEEAAPRPYRSLPWNVGDDGPNRSLRCGTRRVASYRGTGCSSAEIVDRRLPLANRSTRRVLDTDHSWVAWGGNVRTVDAGRPIRSPLEPEDVAASLADDVVGLAIGPVEVEEGHCGGGQQGASHPEQGVAADGADEFVALYLVCHRLLGALAGGAVEFAVVLS